MIVARSRGAMFDFYEDRPGASRGFYPSDERENKACAHRALEALIKQTGGGGFYRYIEALSRDRRALLERLFASAALATSSDDVPPEAR